VHPAFSTLQPPASLGLFLVVSNGNARGIARVKEVLSIRSILVNPNPDPSSFPLLPSVQNLFVCFCRATPSGKTEGQDEFICEY
jgi:hypothetical protein